MKPNKIVTTVVAATQLFVPTLGGPRPHRPHLGDSLNGSTLVGLELRAFTDALKDKIEVELFSHGRKVTIEVPFLMSGTQRTPTLHGQGLDNGQAGQVAATLKKKIDGFSVGLSTPQDDLVGLILAQQAYGSLLQYCTGKPAPIQKDAFVAESAIEALKTVPARSTSEKITWVGKATLADVLTAPSQWVLALRREGKRVDVTVSQKGATAADRPLLPLEIKELADQLDAKLRQGPLPLKKFVGYWSAFSILNPPPTAPSSDGYDPKIS